MYQVLARKYRPRNFVQLVGQTHVSRALTSALERGRLHHAYLFTGTRGVGKTTIARILAKCLNCETGVTATPCEQCTVCKAVNEGRFIDLIEIDAASRTKVEDTRELLDNVPYAPTQGRYKVYLIDEVHMLSTHSFNALLKTLEEPPEHVKFLFATTDPQKLPITIISRCLQFTLRPLAKDEIFNHLDVILTQENIEHEAQALWQLAESAQGSLRDALSLTDQAIAYGQGQVHAQDVREMLGLIDNSLVFDLLLALHQNQRQQVASLLHAMRQQAIDVVHVLEQLISSLHDIALLQCLGQNIESGLIQDLPQKNQLAQLIDAQDLQLYYQIAVQGRADLSLALTPEQGFEMCILRLLAFRPLAYAEVTQNVMPESEVKIAEQSAVTQIDEQQHLAELSNNVVDIQLQSAEISIIPDDQHIAAETEQLNNSEQIIDDTILKKAELNSDSVVIIEQTEIHKDVVENPIQDTKKEVIQSNEVIDHSLSLADDIDTEQVSDLDVDPRQLLLPQSQQLTGSWTLEKWDYWLRNSELSPAVKELAQHGVMYGEITGISELIMNPSYQRIFEGFVETLKLQLQQVNPNMMLKVSYQDKDHTTPMHLQQTRKQQAYTLAQQKILQHETIKGLQQQFSAQITMLKLKS